MHRLLTIVLIVSIAAVLEAQSRYFRIDDNVVENTEYICRITQTPDGFYWLGNGTNLLKFDGKTPENISFTTSTLDVNDDYNITSRMFPDGKGNLWFTTDRAIRKYNPLTKNTQSFQVVTDEKTVTNSYFGCYFNDVTGNFWLRADSCLYAFSPQDSSSTRFATSINAVSFSIEKLDNGSIRVFGSPYIRPGLEVTVVTPDESSFQHEVIPSKANIIQTLPREDGSLLAATSEGLLRFELKNKTLSETYLSQELKDRRCLGVAENKRTGGVWACFPNKGVVLLNPANGKLLQFHPNGPETGIDAPRYLHTDPDNNLWVTNETKGIVVIKDRSNLFSPLPLPFGQKAYDLAQDENKNIFASTDKGKLYRLPPGEAEWRDEASTLGTNNLLHDGRFYFLKDRWYIKAKDAIYRANRPVGKWRRFASSESFFPGLGWQNDLFLRIASDGIHRFRLENDSVISAPLFGSGDTPGSFSGLYMLNDSIFIAPTLNGKLYSFQSGNGGGFVHSVDTLSPTIYAFLKTRSARFFLGTDNGLYEFTDQGPILAVGRISPLNTITINALGEDHLGRVWAGTSNGLLCYDPATKAVRRFSKLDGLPSNQFTYARLVMRPNGLMIAGTQEGVVSFSPEELLSPTEPVEPFIREIWVNRLPISVDSTLQVMDYLKLSPRRNSIDIEVALKGLNQEGMAGVRYRLLGYDDDLFFEEVGGKVTYRKLPSGVYTFRYTAIGQNGDAGQTKELVIDIPPPFTETWTFYLLVILAAFSIVAGTYAFLLRRERSKQIRIREDQEKILAERERIATELHDDLGGDLASMVFIIDGHQYLQQQGVSSELDVGRIGNLANGAIKNMREMIWVLDNSQTTLTALAEQLLSKAREMAGAADLHLQADISEDLPGYSLSSTQKKNILLIGKEAMQNIRKHAHASAFTLRFVTTTNNGKARLLMEITDNGKGLKPLKPSERKPNHGHGLKNLHNRAVAINGTLDISPCLPSGTRVSFSMPL